MTDDYILEAVLQREGGWVDDPADPGGATNMGVTLPTLSAFRGRPVTVAELRALTRLEALALYRDRYVVRPGFDRISNVPLRGLLVDSAVNHGPADAVRFVQRALGGLAVDGVLGPKTLAVIAAADPVRLYVKTCGERMRYYGTLIRNDPKLSKFAAGWADRVADFLDDLPA